MYSTAPFLTSYIYHKLADDWNICNVFVKTITSLILLAIIILRSTLDKCTLSLRIYRIFHSAIPRTSAVLSVLSLPTRPHVRVNDNRQELPELSGDVINC